MEFLLRSATLDSLRLVHIVQNPLCSSAIHTLHNFANKSGLNKKIIKCTFTSEVVSDHLQGTLNCGLPSHNLHGEPEQRTMPKGRTSQVGNISHRTKWSSSPENKLGKISLFDSAR
jgi:hypothetical protein